MLVRDNGNNKPADNKEDVYTYGTEVLQVEKILLKGNRDFHLFIYGVCINHEAYRNAS